MTATVVKVGPLRKWAPDTLVVLPAATAHSRPDENLEPDTDPDTPRWFCRATLRVAIVGKPRGKEAKTAAKRVFRLLILTFSRAFLGAVPQCTRRMTCS